MKQQILQQQLDAAQASAKAAKFQFEFMLVMMQVGRLKEANEALGKGFAALDAILGEGGAA